MLVQWYEVRAPAVSEISVFKPRYGSSVPSIAKKTMLSRCPDLSSFNFLLRLTTSKTFKCEIPLLACLRTQRGVFFLGEESTTFPRCTNGVVHISTRSDYFSLRFSTWILPHVHGGTEKNVSSLEMGGFRLRPEAWS